MEPVRVGVIGAGDISTVYLNAIHRSPALELGAIAARDPGKLTAIAARYDAPSRTVRELLADPAIELILNLTPATMHREINEAIVAAGKHVYSEKPFTLSRASAERLSRQAEAHGTLVGAAPDTFYGSAHQAVRRALDQGLIGAPLFGTSFLGLPGLEMFHPDPAAFYRPGGEPPFDMGPYYIAMWVNLLGPVRQVFATSGRGRTIRSVKRGPRAGTEFAVEVDTSFSTLLRFENATVTLILSLDVVVPTLRPGDLYGANGMMQFADPMFFSGEPRIQLADGAPRGLDTTDLPFATHNRRDHVARPVADYRGVGLTDLAIAIRTGSQHRTTPDLVVHTVEVMEAITASARTHRPVDLLTSCARPAPLNADRDALLVALAASPFDFDCAAPHADDAHAPTTR